MFTGLVETTAVVRNLERRGQEGVVRLGVHLEALVLGESVSVNGVCLTVTRILRDGFDADMSAETLTVSTLGGLRPGQRVNIERASRLGDRMGGHVVLGHVDAVGEVTRFEPVGAAKRLTVQAPPALARFWAPKGSVAIDGVSLTINRLAGPSGFEIMLVPHTQAETTLRDLSAGARVNLEVDVLARYVARQLEEAGITPPAPAPDRSGQGSRHGDGLMTKLRESGYLD